MARPCTDEIRQKLAEMAEREPRTNPAEIVPHLATCPECREELDEASQAVDLLRALPRPHAPADLAAKVRGRIRKRTSRRRSPSFSQRLEVTSAATVLVATIVLASSRVLVPVPERIDEVVQAELRMDSAIPSGSSVESTGDAPADGAVFTVTVESEAVARRILAAAAEAGATWHDGSPIVPENVRRESFEEARHDMWIPAASLPLILPDSENMRSTAPEERANGPVRREAQPTSHRPVRDAHPESLRLRLIIDTDS